MVPPASRILFTGGRPFLAAGIVGAKGSRPLPLGSVSDTLPPALQHGVYKSHLLASSWGHVCVSEQPPTPPRGGIRRKRPGSSDHMCPWLFPRPVLLPRSPWSSPSPTCLRPCFWKSDQDLLVAAAGTTHPAWTATQLQRALPSGLTSAPGRWHLRVRTSLSHSTLDLFPLGPASCFLPRCLSCQSSC